MIMNTSVCLDGQRQYGIGSLGALALLLGLAGSAVAAPMPTTASAYGQRPLSFEPNQGQTAPEVRFLSRGPGYQLFLTAEEAVLALYKPTPKGENSKPISTPQKNAEKAVVRMHLDGANPNASMAGQSPLPGKVNYLRGNDPKQWWTDIPTYEKVKYTNVYPGIDLVYYGRERQLEYDFIVAPGADPKAIALTFSGGHLQLTEAGELVLATATGDVRFQKPVLYQEIEGRKQPVEGQYVRRGAEHIGFEVGAYDTARPLVIDPVLSYSTYLGGSGGDAGTAIAVDAHGQAYITGSTSSDDFPSHNSVQLNREGSPDAFVAKLNAAGNALIYSTYLGGSDFDGGAGIAVDRRGQAYITGITWSEDDFPTTPKAVQPVAEGSPDAFVAKLNAAGNALIYSTYLGGSGGDGGAGIAVDPRGQAYVVGTTWSFSNDFPTQNPLQPARGSFGYNDAFVAKLTAAGNALVYSTYLGGSYHEYGEDITVDSYGQAYIVGWTVSDNFPTTPKALQPVFSGGTPEFDLDYPPSDAFVAKFSAAGNTLIYSTYLGGRSWDSGHGIAVDARGQAYVAGETVSDDFPIQKALQPVRYGIGRASDAFVAKINPIGSKLIYSTYLGGRGRDSGTDIAVTPRGQASVTGHTDSVDFPIQRALQSILGDPGYADAFVTQLNAAGNAFVYSTYLGGNSWDRGYGIAVDLRNQVYVAGSTSSDDFPTTRKALQPGLGSIPEDEGYVPSDAFVVKITRSPQPFEGARLKR
jgi:hypothetical protein